ncbi:MAG TPA: radical SAM protein, partial [Candidatus Bathyarchaeia archaeon]|nr:radical SAM protein [Candidatus Bathyarchaeia archaeon]
YPVTYGPWRGRSPEKIVDEIEVLVKKYDVHAIWFHDQTFSMIPKRTMSLCDEIINRGLHIHWATETRVDRLTPDMIGKMRESGCGRLEVGVETGDETLLKNVGKRGLTPERVEKTIDAIKGEGIIAETNFLVGLPGETWEKTRKTAELIKRIKPDVVTAMIVTPYPGTPLFKMVQENGWLLTKDWSKYTLFEPVFSMPKFSAKDMKRAHAYLYTQYSVYKERLETMEALRRLDIVTLTKKAAHAPSLLRHIPEIVRNRSRKREDE